MTVLRRVIFEVHRRGIARMVNSSTNNMTPWGRALIDVRVPHVALVAPLARWRLRHDVVDRAVWGSERVQSVKRMGRWTWSVELAYERRRPR